MTSLEHKVRPIVSHRKIVRQGKACYISIPLEWLSTHGISDEKELLILADRDIRVVNPKDEKIVYDKVSELVKQGEYQEK